MKRRLLTSVVGIALIAALVTACGAVFGSGDPTEFEGRLQTSSGQCLQNDRVPTPEEQPVSVGFCNGTDAQLWSGDARSPITGTDRCLAPAGGRTVDGTEVVVTDCTGRAEQKWTFLAGGSLALAYSSVCMEATDDDRVVVSRCNGTDRQNWSVLAPEEATDADPSGVPAPSGDLPGWRQIFSDSFTQDSETGSWANECEPEKITYTGEQGQQWRAYPQCFPDTYDNRPYRPDAVLSTGDGMLNFHLRQVDGIPAGANISPVIDPATGEQNQTYGRYSARFKVDDPNLDEYYVAWLLWPQSEVWPRDGELDFPEGSLGGNVGGFHHYADEGSCVEGCQDVAADIGATFDQWHTYTIEWSPGRVRYILDGTVILDSTDWVPSTPMRWQLQTETRGEGNSDGNLMLDWVSVYSYEG